MVLPEQTSLEDQDCNSLLLFMHVEVEKMKKQNKLLTASLSEKQKQENNLDKGINESQTLVMLNDMRISTLEEKSEHLQKVSYDGVLIVEVTNYSQKKAGAMNGTPSFYSDDFYTDRHGYRMCARIYLNGDGVGKGTHLSVFFAIKKGHYDNYLLWPFQRRVTFTLLNQAGKDHLSDAFRPDPMSSSFQKPAKEMNIASGCPMFVAHKVIENPGEGFLRNNTICVQVKVDPPTSC